MRGRSLSILGVAAIVVGAVFILCYKTLHIKGITYACGAIFVVAALVNLLVFGTQYKDTQHGAKVLDFVSNSAGIVLGISMLVFNGTFQPIIAFMFGMLVGVCALWQFFVLAIGSRPYQLPAWLYLFPVILVGGAIFLFLQKIENGDTSLILGFGISFAVLGVACLVEGSVLGIAHRNYEKAKARIEAEKAEGASEAEAVAEKRDLEVEPSAPRRIFDRLGEKRVETTDDLDDEIVN